MVKLKRKLIFLPFLLAFIACMSVQEVNASAPVKYVGCTPSDGTIISDWNFELSFDISDAVSEAGSGVFGLCHKSVKVVLYKGDVAEENKISTTSIPNVTGKSNFVEGKNSISVSLNDEVPILENQLYSIAIQGSFGIMKQGSTSYVSGSAFYWYEDPNPDYDDEYEWLVLKFYGDKPSVTPLVFDSSSIKNGDNLKKINNCLFTFNEPIQIIQDKAILYRNQTVVDEAKLSISGTDPKTVVLNFDEDVELGNGVSYDLVLPEGTIALAENANTLNQEVRIKIIGTTKYYFDFKNSTPAIEEKGFFNTVTLYFDLPSEKTLYASNTYYSKLNGKFYIGEISEGSERTLWGKVTEDGLGISWDIPTTVWEPGQSYFIVKPADDLTLYDKDGNRYPEWSNREDVVVKWYAPNIEDVKYSALEFGTPVIGRHDEGAPEFVEGGTYAKWDSYLEIPLKDLKHSIDGELYSLGLKNSVDAAKLYEVVDGEDVLVSEHTITIATRETPLMYYNVAQVWLKNTFYEGKTYKLVFPEGTFYAGPKTMVNYLSSPELVYTFNGSTPTEVRLISCSLENATVDYLYSVNWTFNGLFELNDDNFVLKFKGIDNNGGYTCTPSMKLVKQNTNSGTTDVLAYVAIGTGSNLEFGRMCGGYGEYEVTFPAGVLVYPSDETITNEAFVTKFNVIKKEAIVPQEPEFVNLEVEVNGFHTVGLEAVKDRKVSVKLIPDENWKVDEILRDGNMVTDWYDETTGIYTTPKLTADSKIKATIEYKHELVFADKATGVAELPESNVRVYTDENGIVIDGLNGGESIEVYSVAGLVIGKHTAQQDTVKIAVVSGQYIVRVNNEAAKIQF